MLIDSSAPHPPGLLFRSRKIALVWLGVSLLLDEMALYAFMQAVDLGKGKASPFWQALFGQVPFWTVVVLFAFVLPMVLWFALRVVAGPIRANTLALGAVASLMTLIFAFALLYLYAWLNYQVRFR